MEKKRIVVAMSGGVDSSVVAAMLHEQGHEVIGITLQLYDYGDAAKKKGACCAGQDIYDARRVCEELGVPHYVLNYESRFREGVIDDFVDTYLSGGTPIPCVRCNQRLKFKDLLETARDLGADKMATGHYVRKEIIGNQSAMLKGQDPKRDQSYFLFATTNEQLDFLEFPLGGLEKSATRDLARKYGLEISEKPDSQDICFVPNGKYQEVIEKYRPGSLDPGNIVDLEGNILGEHVGVIGYTVGQRRGLGISAAEPLYVVKIDADKKEVTVGPKEALAVSTVHINDCNWLTEPDAKRETIVKFRSTHDGVPAYVEHSGSGKATVTFIEPQYGVSPGQACVAYDNDRLMGGGWIFSVSNLPS
jgi:tRNA-specific 2-thiouridylase